MPKIAIVHDWLVNHAGSEKVLQQLLACYPDAVLFAVIDGLSGRDRGFLEGRVVHTTWLQHWPLIKSHHRSFFPLMPWAIQHLDLSGFDVVLSSSHAVAKGIRVQQALHVCYCHTPARYAWDMQDGYLLDAGMATGLKGRLARRYLEWFRAWDLRAAQRVDHFIANSAYVQQRIMNVYQRQSVVIHPPVDTEFFDMVTDKDGYYLAASRMVPYKRMDVIIQAFGRLPGRRLVVIGDGPEQARYRAMAGPNVLFLGYQDHLQLRRYMQGARAFVFAADEDFGIMPVEAQACGTPVLAYRKGGALETVRGVEQDAATGVFFDEQTPESIAEAVMRFEDIPVGTLSPLNCRIQAERFSISRFRENITTYVERCWIGVRQKPV